MKWIAVEWRHVLVSLSNAWKCACTGQRLFFERGSAPTSNPRRVTGRNCRTGNRFGRCPPDLPDKAVKLQAARLMLCDTGPGRAGAVSSRHRRLRSRSQRSHPPRSHRSSRAGCSRTCVKRPIQKLSYDSGPAGPTVRSICATRAAIRGILAGDVEPTMRAKQLRDRLLGLNDTRRPSIAFESPTMREPALLTPSNANSTARRP